MNSKFWIAYLPIVVLLLGVAYSYLGTVGASNAPLALSSAEMVQLRGGDTVMEHFWCEGFDKCDEYDCSEQTLNKSQVAIIYYEQCTPAYDWDCTLFSENSPYCVQTYYNDGCNEPATWIWTQTIHECTSTPR